MAFIDPQEIIDDLPLKKDMAAADFGCGSGSWVIPLAERLDEGIIYAIDLLEEPLSVLRSYLNREGIANVKVLNENIEKGSSIRDERIDLVLMTNFLFQVTDKKKVVSEAKRILKKDGFLLVIEWSPNSPIGPKTEKIDPQTLKKIVAENDFILKDEFQAGMYHYGFLYQK